MITFDFIKVVIAVTEDKFIMNSKLMLLVCLLVVAVAAANVLPLEASVPDTGMLYY